MTIYKNKALYVRSSDTEVFSEIPLTTVNKEILLTSDLVSYEYFDETAPGYKRAVREPVSLRVTRVLLLNDDATVKEDVSEYISQWSLDMEYGDSRISKSASLTILNYDDTWRPSPTSGRLWKGAKFKIMLGIYYDGILYWRDYGIFVAGNLSINEAERTIGVQLYDKFALLDGTVNGKRNYDFRINRGVTIKNAVELCLTENSVFTPDDKKDVLIDDPFDSSKPIFPEGTRPWGDSGRKYYTEITTPYTYRKDPNGTMGEMIMEFAKMLTCDVYYNDNGNLVFTPGAVTNQDLLQNDIVWEFNDSPKEYTDPSYSIDWDNIVSEVVVAGAIENGRQYKGYAQNTDIKSQMNVFMTLPNPLHIEDSNIYGDTACTERAGYELTSQGRMAIKLSFDSIFIPHLNVNDIIVFNCKRLNFIYTRFIINSISISDNGLLSITATNIEEVTV